MLKFQVDGMSCDHCVRAVTEAVQSADPDAKVDIDLESKKVAVDSRRESAAIAEAIREAGYEPVALA